MRGYLFWANSLEESLHVVVMRKEDWVCISVVWVLIAVSHSGDFTRVVVTSVFLHIFRLRTIKKMGAFRKMVLNIESERLTVLSSWKPAIPFF